MLTRLKGFAAVEQRLRSPLGLVCAVFVLTRIVLLLLTVKEPWFDLPSVTQDVRNFYFDWFESLSQGRFPHGDVQWQYPPGAALPLLAPALLPFTYATSFYLLSFLFDVFAFVVLLRAAGRRSARARVDGSTAGDRPWAAWVWTVGVALGGPIGYARYDLIVTAITISGLVLLADLASDARRSAARRWFGGALIGLATMMKVWPGLLLLALGPARRARAAWVSATVTGGALLLVFWVTMPDALSFIANQRDRGIEIESVAALPFHIAIHHGWDGMIGLNYGSLEFLGPHVHLVSLIALACSLVALIWLVVWRLRVRTWHRSTAADASLVAVTMFVVTSRVISPQYMIWMVGLGAVCALEFGPRGDSVMQIPVVLVLLATALSSVDYPYWFDQLVQAQGGAVILVTLRNLLLVAAVFVGASRLWRSTRAAGAAAAQPIDPDGRQVDAGTVRLAAMAIAVSIAVAAHSYHGNPHQFFDLRIYHSAMRWWVAGHPLYDYSQPDYFQGHLGFTYPPFAAVLLRPLAGLTVHTAIEAYSLVGIGLMAASLWWLVTPWADRRGWPRWFTFGIAAVLASGLEPIRETFTFGQINPVVWALVLFDLLVLGPRGHRAFGVGIGLATAVKLTPGLFVVYLLATRRGRAAGMAAAAFVAANGLALIVAPHTTWVYFSDKLWQTEAVGHVEFLSNQSVLGALARMASPAGPSHLLWLVVCIPLLVVGMQRARLAALSGDELAGLTIVGFISGALSPITWTHHLVWFVPGLIVLADVVATPGPIRRRSLAGVAALTCYATVTYSVVLAGAAGHFTGPLGQALGRNWDLWLAIAFVMFLPIRTAPPAPDSPSNMLPAARSGVLDTAAGRITSPAGVLGRRADPQSP